MKPGDRIRFRLAPLQRKANDDRNDRGYSADNRYEGTVRAIDPERVRLVDVLKAGHPQPDRGYALARLDEVRILGHVEMAPEPENILDVIAELEDEPQPPPEKDVRDMTPAEIVQLLADLGHDDTCKCGG